MSKKKKIIAALFFAATVASGILNIAEATSIQTDFHIDREKSYYYIRDEFEDGKSGYDEKTDSYYTEMVPTGEKTIIGQHCAVVSSTGNGGYDLYNGHVHIEREGNHVCATFNDAYDKEFRQKSKIAGADSYSELALQAIKSIDPNAQPAFGEPWKTSDVVMSENGFIPGANKYVALGEDDTDKGKGVGQVEIKPIQSTTNEEIKKILEKRDEKNQELTEEEQKKLDNIDLIEFVRQKRKEGICTPGQNDWNKTNNALADAADCITGYSVGSTAIWDAYEYYQSPAVGEAMPDHKDLPLYYIAEKYPKFFLEFANEEEKAKYMKTPKDSQEYEDYCARVEGREPQNISNTPEKKEPEKEGEKDGGGFDAGKMTAAIAGATALLGAAYQLLKEKGDDIDAVNEAQEMIERANNEIARAKEMFAKDRETRFLQAIADGNVTEAIRGWDRNGEPIFQGETTPDSSGCCLYMPSEKYAAKYYEQKDIEDEIRAKENQAKAEERKKTLPKAHFSDHNLEPGEYVDIETGEIFCVDQTCGGYLPIEPVEQVTIEPVKQMSTGTLKQISTEPAEQIALEPAKQVAAEPAEQVAAEPAKQMSTETLKQIQDNTKEAFETPQQTSQMTQSMQNTIRTNYGHQSYSNTGSSTNFSSGTSGSGHSISRYSNMSDMPDTTSLDTEPPTYNDASYADEFVQNTNGDMTTQHANTDSQSSGYNVSQSGSVQEPSISERATNVDEETFKNYMQNIQKR